MKTVVEFPLVLMASKFFGKTRFIGWFPVVQIMNLFYVSIIGLLGVVVPHEWKNRTIRIQGKDAE